MFVFILICVTQLADVTAKFVISVRCPPSKGEQAREAPVVSRVKETDKFKMKMF